MSENAATDSRWARFRSLMPVTERWSYMDHAAVAPIPAPTRDCMLEWCRQLAADGDVVWPQWAERVEGVRRRCAALVGADTAEIAFVSNTTAGINVVAEGLDWRAGDNVVTLANEFPSNVYPWMNLADKGVETRRVAIEGGAVDLERLLAHCDRRTRLITVSWVSYCTGWRLDLAPLVARAHEAGILVFLDAIQGLGVFSLDVRRTPVDFLAADGHKWLLGPEGAGILYVRRELLERLRPTGVGWNSVSHAHDFHRIQFDLRPSAERFEGGSRNMVGVLALGASVELLMEMGLSSGESAVADRVLAIADQAAARLQRAGAVIVNPCPAEHRSGIVLFDVPGHDALQVRRECLQAGVVLSCRAGHLRISPHGYASDDDVERLVGVVERLA